MTNPKVSSLIIIFFVVVFISSSSISPASSFNITRLLDERHEFSSFNIYLTQTKLNDEINRRQTITVLAIDNDAIASFSSKPLEIVKKIMSVHVILDYFDVGKITKLGISNKTFKVTTLFQASGSAVDQEGFLKVALVKEGEIAFDSSVKGASFTKLVKSVLAQPFNISVLQITAPVHVPGIESTLPSLPKDAAPVKSPGKAPSPSKISRAPTPVAEGAVIDAPSATAPATEGPVANDDPMRSSSQQANAKANPPMLSGFGDVQMRMNIEGVVAMVLVSCLLV